MALPWERRWASGQSSEGLALAGRDDGGGAKWGAAESEQHRTPTICRLGFGCDPLTHTDGSGLLRGPHEPVLAERLRWMGRQSSDGWLFLV